MLYVIPAAAIAALATLIAAAALCRCNRLSRALAAQTALRRLTEVTLARDINALTAAGRDPDRDRAAREARVLAQADLIITSALATHRTTRSQTPRGGTDG